MKTYRLLPSFVLLRIDNLLSALVGDLFNSIHFVLSLFISFFRPQSNYELLAVVQSDTSARTATTAKAKSATSSSAGGSWMQ
jgi:hypothetical protein